eukprot:5536488-Amphidinium_carterae.1
MTSQHCTTLSIRRKIVQGRTVNQLHSQPCQDGPHCLTLVMLAFWWLQDASVAIDLKLIYANSAYQYMGAALEGSTLTCRHAVQFGDNLCVKKKSCIGRHTLPTLSVSA